MGAMPSAGKPIEDLAGALHDAYPELEAVRAAAEEPVYVVGGAVRDLLLGRGRADLDLVVEGDAEALATRLGAEPVAYERFGTAKVVLEGHEVDIAAARTETYPSPGALPEVVAAPGIEQDLWRRDFTVNAMAIALAEPERLIDPLGGRGDLEGSRLRLLHPLSLRDDPTRAIRAARYAARLALTPEPETAKLLTAADLGTVSAERRKAELLRLAAEATAPRGFELLGKWGVVEARPEGVELATRVAALLESQPWRSFADRPRAVYDAALGGSAAELDLAASRPGLPSEAVELARGHDAVELVLARALGAEWLDEYVGSWSQVELEIRGEDLVWAGVAPGPAIGHGLAVALRAKLDGEVSGREQELAVALAAVGEAS
jgi:tRNA nucleotidyltransferase (CCA-adding enzyme)